MTAGRTAVLHVITGLRMGGAETALSRLLATLPSGEFPATVVSLLPGGPLSERIQSLGVPVRSLGMRRSLPSLRGALALRRIVRELRPAIIQGWMYHGNLAGWFARSVGRTPARLVWNIRQSLYDLRRERPGTRLAIRLGARLSVQCDAIVYNSQLARRQHEAIGYAAARARVIPNGFDCEQFRPRADAGAALRAELGVPPERLLVGLVSRYHPMKGHEIFFEAARRVLDAGVDAAFVCAGPDVTAANPRLAEPIGRLGLAERVHLLGERHDTPTLFSGFDVSCSASSWGEGFPNAVGEALASGTPCVATDVGDTAVVLGPSGTLVPPGDPEALAEGLRRLLAATPETRREAGALGRQRVQREFSLDRVTEMYAEFYRTLGDGSHSS